MRTHRQQATIGLLVLAVLLGSLWAGALGGSGAGDPADQLTASRSPVDVEAAVLPDRAPALRPSAERPDAGGRLLPLLLGVPLAALAAAFSLRARRLGSDLAPAGSLVWSNQREARAPPSLQPA
jgi:hypothetical protein